MAISYPTEPVVEQQQEEIKSRLCNIEAEDAFLSILIEDPNLFLDYYGRIKDLDFFDSKNREIWKILVDTYSKNNRSLDAILVLNNLNNSNSALAKLLKEKILSLISQFRLSANIENYFQIIKENSVKRSLVNLSNEIFSKAIASSSSLPLVVEIERRLNDISSFLKDNKKIFTLSKALDLEIENMRKMEMTGKSFYGVPVSFYPSLEDLIVGFHNSEITVIASRPGVGKTSFAINLAVNAARRTKSKILFFSLEMSVSHIMRRIISSYCGISMKETRISSLSKSSKELFKEYEQEIRSMDITIIDSSGLSFHAIKGVCMDAYNQNGLDIVFIDYLSLISLFDSGSTAKEFLTRKAESKAYELAEICVNIKNLSKELDIPIVCLAQLSRLAEQEGSRPMLHQLKSSGGIEENFDNVFSLTRSGGQNSNRQSNSNSKTRSDLIPGEVDLTILKQRNGRMGQVIFSFDAEFGTFTDTGIDV